MGRFSRLLCVHDICSCAAQKRSVCFLFPGAPVGLRLSAHRLHVDSVLSQHGQRSSAPDRHSSAASQRTLSLCFVLLEAQLWKGLGFTDRRWNRTNPIQSKGLCVLIKKPSLPVYVRKPRRREDLRHPHYKGLYTFNWVIYFTQQYTYFFFAPRANEWKERRPLLLYTPTHHNTAVLYFTQEVNPWKRSGQIVF